MKVFISQDKVKCIACLHKVTKCICYESEEDIQSIDKAIFESGEPIFIEVKIKEDTYVFPKLEFGKLNQDQEPLLERKLYDEINNMDIGRKADEKSNYNRRDRRCGYGVDKRVD